MDNNLLMQANQGIIGKRTGSNIVLSVGEFGDLLLTELLPRYYQNTYRGNVYSSGMGLTSISNATFTTADALSGTLATAATATPICGLYNPPPSGMNAVILQANVQTIMTALQATGPGGYFWASYAPVNTITVGSQQVPVNRKTFLASGSAMRGLFGLALTGLANTGLFLAASALSSGAAYNASLLGTAVGFMAQAPGGFEDIDGSIIVPPGGVLGLFCNTTPVAHSAISSLTWMEMPV